MHDLRSNVTRHVNIAEKMYDGIDFLYYAPQTQQVYVGLDGGSVWKCSITTGQPQHVLQLTAGVSLLEFLADETLLVITQNNKSHAVEKRTLAHSVVWRHEFSSQPHVSLSPGRKLIAVRYGAGLTTPTNVYSLSGKLKNSYRHRSDIKAPHTVPSQIQIANNGAVWVEDTFYEP